MFPSWSPAAMPYSGCSRGGAPEAWPGGQAPNASLAVEGEAMKVAIMQPYFLPYVGYFQLIEAVDRFVVYDNIKYTKKGWFNRNRFLLNGSDAMFSIPLKRDSDSLDVREREVSPDYDPEKLAGQLKGAYARAPYFEHGFELVRSVLPADEANLFRFIRRSIDAVVDRLGIDTRIVVSSSVDTDHSLKGQDRVLSICESLGATTYVNAIGGVGLYSRDDFAERGIDLRFIRSRPLEYRQFGAPFVPWLSIVDLLMFNSAADVKRMLAEYDLI
ncbi:MULTISPECIES: WbqC family protein [Burkholderia cepacia complex]|uniref:WbqC family protein n=1 Tax=Burkholderia cepacia complex TaxID=87882 RepID=UPI001FC8E4C3|nr:MULTISPECIES: WbqC family protein [Burkholderia cepacia complex]